MANDVFKGQWNQFKGKVKEKWGKLTDSDITQIEGKRDQLLGKLQEKYGHTKEAAEKELSKFESEFSSKSCSNNDKGDRGCGCH